MKESKLYTLPWLKRKKIHLCTSRAFSCHSWNRCNSVTKSKVMKRTSCFIINISLWLATNLSLPWPHVSVIFFINSDHPTGLTFLMSMKRKVEGQLFVQAQRMHLLQQLELKLKKNPKPNSGPNCSVLYSREQ